MIGELKVGAKTNPRSAAGALASMVREGKTKIEATVIGAASINQLAKTVAIARGYIASSGKDLIMKPSFTEVEIEGEERTAMFFVIEVHND